MFRAIWTDSTGVTGITGTGQNLDWNIWQTGDTSVFAPLKATGGTPIPGTDLMRYVRCKLPGRYTFNVAVDVQDAVDGFKISLNDDDVPWGLSEDYHHGPTGAYNLTGFTAFSFARIFPYIDPGDSAFAGELVEWPPDMAGADSVEVYFTMAADIATSTEVKFATLEVTYEPVKFPTSTAWPTS